MSRTLPHRVLKLLPPGWRADYGGIAAEPVRGGMSGAEVFRLDTRPGAILKLGLDDVAPLVVQEAERTAWLAAQGAPVPAVLRQFAVEGLAGMLSSAIEGKPAELCGPEVLPDIARALARLHALPVENCPYDERIAVRIARARRAAAAGEIDPSHFATRNRNVSPHELLTRLATAPPRETLVVAHGDASLSNILIGPSPAVTGRSGAGTPSHGAVTFIDCGHAGRADRYLDLGVTAGELAHVFGRRSVATFAAAYSGRPWDAAKAAYFSDLYELF